MYSYIDTNTMRIAGSHDGFVLKVILCFYLRTSIITAFEKLATRGMYKNVYAHASMSVAHAKVQSWYVRDRPTRNILTEVLLRLFRNDLAVFLHLAAAAYKVI